MTLIAAPAPRETRRVGGYREYAPPAELARLVDTLWVYSIPDLPAGVWQPPWHRVLPELGVSLSFRCWRDEATGRVLDGELAFQGPIRAAQPFAPSRAYYLESIRVAPEWSAALFGADPAAHADGVDAYRLVSRRRAARLHDRLARTTTSAQALQALLDEVRELRDDARPSRAVLVAHRAAELIRARQGALSLPDIARAVGVSERQLRRIVRETTGIGAKQLQRVHRLNRAVCIADWCGEQRRPPWARIAAQAGYYDQSHLIREVLALSGRTPAELHAERQAENSAPSTA
ncbi:MAG TPA: helix-turn-helix domain-containing protein [Gemmatimonadaceae bacterium]|nr:helix-turn-helix domain-containing protein [Gemmatimonadaceae bacterium]